MQITHPALIAGAADDVALCGDHVPYFQAVLLADSGADRDDAAQELVTHHALVSAIFCQAAVDHVAEGLAPPDPAIASAKAGVHDFDDYFGAIGTVRTLVELGHGNSFPDQTGTRFPGFSAAVKGQGQHLGHRGSSRTLTLTVVSVSGGG